VHFCKKSERARLALKKRLVFPAHPGNEAPIW